MTVNFAKTMRRLSDEELYQVAYPGADEDFEPEAITAARLEVGRRGLSDADAREVQVRLSVKREQGRAGSFREHLEFTRPPTAIERIGQGALLLLLIV